jgi:hypothetical protein
MSLLEYALNFGLNIPERDKVLLSVNSERQLKEIVQAVKCPSSLGAYPIDYINLLNPSLGKT